jgi:hypothetical protein
MTPEERKAVDKAARAFSISPNPALADSLLRLLGPHRQDNEHIRNTINYVLDYKFLVGNIDNPKEVASSSDQELVL